MNLLAQLLALNFEVTAQIARGDMRESFQDAMAPYKQKKRGESENSVPVTASDGTQTESR